MSTPSEAIKVFVSYSRIRVGESWDELIKTQIQAADIALVLVSQYFLDSKYCQDVEIRGFLAKKSYLFPIILSPCEWRRHEWLSSRQFLPGGDQTIEEHYTDLGRLKRLFLEIRQQLRERVELLRQAPPAPHPVASDPPPEIAPPFTSIPGRIKLKICQRLGNDWPDLADVCDIPNYERRRFTSGEECRAVLEWLENRQRLAELPQALIDIKRPDLTELLRQSP
jgi:hypothetical protein